MTINAHLHARSEGKCELCGTDDDLAIQLVTPHDIESPETCLLACGTCRRQIDDPATVDGHHWRCLNESMWSQVPAVQVIAWRMLDRLSGEGWARNLIDMLYLDDDTLAWAKGADTSGDDDTAVEHKDSNGTALTAGDTVTLIKDLNVKGAGFTAKRGTAVRNISVVHDNAAHIEGRVNGQQIVILTEFVKKSG